MVDQNCGFKQMLEGGKVPDCVPQVVLCDGCEGTTYSGALPLSKLCIGSLIAKYGDDNDGFAVAQSLLNTPYSSLDFDSTIRNEIQAEKNA